MATTISDNGAKITITIGTKTRQVLKNQIRNVSVIKPGNIVIETSQGTSRNIFIPYSEVSSPACADAANLRDTILGYLEAAAGPTGLATEAKQIEGNSTLAGVLLALGNIQNLLSSIDNKNFYQPLLIEVGGTGVTYKGYANPGTSEEAPGWAIEKITSVEGSEVHTWANGNRNFTNTWAGRGTLTYS